MHNRNFYEIMLKGIEKKNRPIFPEVFWGEVDDLAEMNYLTRDWFTESDVIRLLVHQNYVCFAVTCVNVLLAII